MTESETENGGESLPRVTYKKEYVEIVLKRPIEIGEVVEKIHIKYMTGKHYRNTKSEMGSRAEIFELLETLSGLATTEVNDLRDDDLGACLGVINNFLLRLHGKSLEFTQDSLKPFLQLLQVNSTP